MEQQQCSLEDLEIMSKLSDKLAGFFGRLFPMSRNKTIKLNNEIRQTESEHFAQLCEMLGFLENSLNISETARQLFVHRNTLVYRLEKIQKQTGLDVRVFEDALAFKIALMVADHMKFIENRK